MKIKNVEISQNYAIVKSAMSDDKNTESPRNANGFNSLAFSILPTIRKIIGKKGAVAADLLVMWRQIVGEETASYTFPEAVDFPRGTHSNGTLRLKVPSGAFALEVKHREKFIIEKINTYFGYGVVSAVKIFQDAGLTRRISAESNQPPMQKILVSEEEQNYITDITKGIADDELRERLAELGKKILNSNRK